MEIKSHNDTENNKKIIENLNANKLVAVDVLIIPEITTNTQRENTNTEMDKREGMSSFD